jgi:PAS domain S-box-containing protein
MDAELEGDARFRSIVEASPVPYAINDEQGNVTYVNPAFVATFGYSRDDIPTLDQWWPRAYPDAEYRHWAVTEWKARLDRARQDGTPFEHFEVKIQAKDGTQRFAVAGALSLEAEFRGVHVVVLVDITERKRAEEARLSLERQVQHSQKLESLGVLAGGIAHDFNNLLAAILLNADLALADLPEASPARSSIEAIFGSARRASEVVNQMLAYSGRGKFLATSLGISDLVAEMSQLLEVAISKKVEIRSTLEAGLPEFDGDATQVRQIVMNLITNASEAIGDATGVVTLTTGAMFCDRAYLDGDAIVRDRRHGALRSEGMYVFLEVADTGCGMTPATIGRIFEPFFTTKFTGRGLGLSALLGIVDGHAGAISIRSEVGTGTTIRVLFPANDAAAVAPSPTAVRRPRPEVVERRTLLVVDDEEALRRAVRQMLEHLGFDVLIAANGQEAIALFHEHQGEIAAVILDLTMPVLDGEQTFRELRMVRGDVKVILSSGYTSHEVSRRFADGGLAGFLKKPFDMDELRSVLADVFSA